jgi:hypothetical protein
MAQSSFAHYLKFILHPTGEEFRYQNWCDTPIAYEGKTYSHLDFSVASVTAELALGGTETTIEIPIGDDFARVWRERFMAFKGFGRSRIEVITIAPTEVNIPAQEFLYRVISSRESDQGTIELTVRPAYSAVTAAISSANANQVLIPELPRLAPRG